MTEHKTPGERLRDLRKAIDALLIEIDPVPPVNMSAESALVRINQVFKDERAGLLHRIECLEQSRMKACAEAGAFAERCCKLSVALADLIEAEDASMNGFSAKEIDAIEKAMAKARATLEGGSA